MDFKEPYVVLRVEENGALGVVHKAATLKDVRYWLQYIALPGDAIFQTPLHPKLQGKTDVAYFGHLQARGKIEHDEKLWRGFGLGEKPVLPAIKE